MAAPIITPRKIEYLQVLAGLGCGWHSVHTVGALVGTRKGDASDMMRRLYAGGWIQLATPSARINSASKVRLTPAGRLVVREREGDA